VPSVILNVKDYIETVFDAVECVHSQAGQSKDVRSSTEGGEGTCESACQDPV